MNFKNLLFLLSFALLSGCGHHHAQDYYHKYNRAIISLQGIKIEGEIIEWKVYEYGNIVKILMKDGKEYLTSSANVILISENQ